MEEYVKKKSKYTIEYITNLVNTYRNGEFELIKIENLRGYRTLVSVKHKPCGRILTNQNIANFIGLDRGCKFCNSNRMDKKKIIDMVNSINGYRIISCNSNKVSDKIKIIHEDCGYIFNMRAADFIYNKYRCPKCGHEISYTESSLKKKISEITNNEYSVEKVYVNANTKPSRWKLDVKHNTCRKIMNVSAHNFIINNQRCPICNKNKKAITHISKGKKLIESFLVENNINFETEKTFSGLKYKNQLRLDFYFAFKNDQIAIEYDGKQHFKSSSKSTAIFSPEKLEITKKRDKIKDEYCDKNNIKLYRIPYTYLDDEIIETLKEILSVNNI